MIIFALWIAAIVGHYVVGATLVWILWQWFAVPHGAPVLNVAYIAGIMLLARTLIGPRFPSQSPNQTQLIGQVVGVYLFYLFAFGIGWVICFTL